MFARVCFSAAAVTLPFALSFLLAPEQIAAPYGIVGFNAGTLMVARLFGAALLFGGAAAFAVRTTEDAGTQRRVGAAFAVASLVAALVSAHAVVSGAVNALGWSTTAIYAAFMLAWARVALAAGRLQLHG